MASNTLRIDPGDGSPVVDYRIENGRVERRVLELVDSQENFRYQWRPLTPQELNSHVMSGTTLAHWLRLKIGIFRLLKAFSSDPSSTMN